jgi:hypothetical protein
MFDEMGLTKSDKPGQDITPVMSEAERLLDSRSLVRLEKLLSSRELSPRKIHYSSRFIKLQLKFIPRHSERPIG